MAGNPHRVLEDDHAAESAMQGRADCSSWRKNDADIAPILCGIR